MFREMRGKCLERGIKCGLADSYAMQSVQLYKRFVRRGCAEAFEIVTSDKRADHYAKICDDAFLRSVERRLSGGSTQ